MYRPIRRTIVTGALVAILALATGVSEAHAGWWHGSHGSYGSYGSSGSWGSHGSHGSSGYASYSSYGSRGGGLFSHLRHKWHGHRYAWGSSGGSSGGSWGSSGGSWGSYGSYGSRRGWASCGSSGGGMYYQPVVPAVPSDAMPPEPPPAGGEQSTSVERDAYLTVAVPADAKVYVNNVATRSTGAERTYVSRNLAPGFDYTYRVRAEYAINGQIQSSEKTIQLRAGQTSKVGFAMEPAAEILTTTLKVNVPENAQVTLAGNPTQASGAQRVFTTTRLAAGESWDAYVIHVSVDRDGRKITRQQTITLVSGETRELDFDFSDNKLAAAR